MMRQSSYARYTYLGMHEQSVALRKLPRTINIYEIVIVANPSVR